MKPIRIFLLVVVFLLLATALWISRAKRPALPLEAEMMEPARTKAAGTRPTTAPAGNLTVESVVKIPAKEWQSRFATGYQDVDPEIRSQIVLLAGELQKSVEEGLDPKGEEALAYGETILVLLAEKTVGK